MKKLLKTIALFVIIDIFIIFFALFLIEDPRQSKANVVENPNKIFNIANGTDETLNIQIKIGASNLYKYSLEASSHRIVKILQEHSDECEILYCIEKEDENEGYKFFSNQLPSSYYIILTKDKEFIFETISNLN